MKSHGFSLIPTVLILALITPYAGAHDGETKLLVTVKSTNTEVKVMIAGQGEARVVDTLVRESSREAEARAESAAPSTARKDGSGSNPSMDIVRREFKEPASPAPEEPYEIIYGKVTPPRIRTSDISSGKTVPIDEEPPPVLFGQVTPPPERSSSLPEGKTGF